MTLSVFPTSFSGYNINAVKSHNRRTILKALLQREPLSRVDLARMTALSTTTITNQVAALLELGYVAEVGEVDIVGKRGVGRPRTALRLQPDAGFALGVHIGVGRVRAVVTNLRAQIHSENSWTHEPDMPPETVVERIIHMLGDVIERAEIEPRRIIGLGVGASGLVDPDRGVNVFAPNLGWRDVPLRAWLTAQTGLPVSVDNNVRLMALGEALFGLGREQGAQAFIYGRVGVGAGFWLGDQLYRGGQAGAGEIGHMTILPTGGPRCRCGNSGCLETLVSEPVLLALAEQLRQQFPDSHLARLGQDQMRLTLDDLFAAARAGDDPVRELLRERGVYMGIALANVVNTFNPNLIVLGGMLAQGFDLWQPVLEETVRQRAFAQLGSRLQLVKSQFEHRAGMIGAAALALQDFFYDAEDLPPINGYPHRYLSFTTLDAAP